MYMADVTRMDGGMRREGNEREEGSKGGGFAY